MDFQDFTLDAEYKDYVNCGADEEDFGIEFEENYTELEF